MARILVVDDREDVRLALIALLEDAGHEVFAAEDGSEVMEMTLSGQPDLILLDIVMPRVDGFETLRRLKTDERTDGVPVVIVTARSRAQDLARAWALGALDYISKPWVDGEVELRVGWALASPGERV
ncbi:MAG: response regulator [Dehalococcoidia bacterium]